MSRGRRHDPDNPAILLNHIHSLGMVSAKDMPGGAVEMLLEQGLIRQVWIGNFALTEKGQKTRKGSIRP